MKTSDSEPELPRGIALAWGVAATPQRGPRRELSVEGIVATAMEIADAEDLTAVSMTAVAAKLGYTTMSLYRYVSAKEDMVLLMYEQAFGVPPRPDGDVGWREAARALFDSQLAVYRARPWVLDIPIRGIPSTPNTVAWMDAGLAAFESTPLSQADRLSATLLLSGQAYWQSLIERMYTQAAPDESTLEEVERSWEQMLRSLVTAEQFPAVSRVLEEGLLGPESTNDPFAVGVELVLDGIARLVDASQGGLPHGSGQQPEAEEPDESEAAPAGPRSVEIEAAVMKETAVREASRKRREAETKLREAETKLREAQRKEQDVLAKSRERARKRAGK
ncbi:TetR/AcrR family transcriptional regulator C-terminal domain-containing protein [Arthrobacter castelli]|uniref:TetR/AcrR family transcriptional regulator C-terminal domain-containing protein n=1 Tax=Arthrobacter castelli TaxID=271431 RepID=UPI0005644849|nr:TetR/AcrR family transcriptional regulator C-terminal domain-containing protein [Arthrobacter castelli]